MDDSDRGTTHDQAEAARRDRMLLIRACVELDDLLTNEALRAKVRQALARVGVEAREPVGEVFDPERHFAAGREPTPDPAMHNRIAMVPYAGFNDRGSTIRAPYVIVLQNEPISSATRSATACDQ